MTHFCVGDWLNYVTKRGLQVRGKLKAKACPLVEVMLKFHSSQTKSAIKKNCEMAEELKEGANFAFKVWYFMYAQCMWLLICVG